MKSNKIVYLIGMITLILSIIRFSSIIRVGTNQNLASGQQSGSCSDLRLKTESEKSRFAPDDFITISLLGVPENVNAEFLLKTVSGSSDGIEHSLPHYVSIADGSLQAEIDIQNYLSGTVTDTVDQFFVIHANIFDVNGNLVCNGDPYIDETDPTYCPGCVKLISVSDKPVIAPINKSTEVITFAENSTPSATPTASPSVSPTPTPTPVTYFRFDYPPNTEKFTYKLLDEFQIQETRDILLLPVEERPHVAGVIRKQAQPVDYNKPWQYYLDPYNIVYFTGGYDYCDGSIADVQKALFDIGDPKTYAAGFGWSGNGQSGSVDLGSFGICISQSPSGKATCNGGSIDNRSPHTLTSTYKVDGNAVWSGTVGPNKTTLVNFSYADSSNHTASFDWTNEVGASGTVNVGNFGSCNTPSPSGTASCTGASISNPNSFAIDTQFYINGRVSWSGNVSAQSTVPISYLYMYLPESVWCPLGSRILEEVDDPFTPICTPTDGDANGDGVANGNDFTAWLRNFSTENPLPDGPNTAKGDFNCDGFVNGNDFTRWLRNFTTE